MRPPRVHLSAATVVLLALCALVFLFSIAPALGAQDTAVPCRDCVRPIPPTLIPPQVVRTSSAVRVTLADRVLRWEVTQKFQNRGGRVGEADFLYPLPPGAAFQDLKLSINGELVAGEVMNATEARRVYEEIVRRMRDPALVEWMGYGLLRARIFPIAPGETKTVVVRYQVVAVREGDALRVDWTRGGGTVAGAGGWQAQTENSSFELTIDGAGEFGTPYSPTHTLATSNDGSRRIVRATGDARELTILLPIRRREEASISVLTYAPGNEDGFALIALSPPDGGDRYGARGMSRDVTFVVDVSGSMSGRKLEQARAAGKQLLSSLAQRDRFRVIDFSTDVRTFRDDFVDATPINVQAASRYLDQLDADGSTNISGALDAALAAPEREGRLPVILFVTDGEPTVGERNADAIAAAASRARGRRRIFTFGVGSDVNAGLVEQLALEGHGTAQFVRPDESVERAVSLVAQRLTSPVATDLTLRADGDDRNPDIRLLKVEPSATADLFAGQDLVVLARYQGSGRATLRFEGTGANGPVRWTSTVNLPDRARDNGYIARLWATRRLGFLSAEKRKHGASSEIDGEIRELGERYGIPTEFTSYFVKEPGMDVAQFRLRDDRPAPPGAQLAPLSIGTTGSAAPANEQRFEAAKSAAAQRAANSVSAADSMSVGGQGYGLKGGVGDREKDRAGAFGRGATRRAGNRIFVLRDGVWVDAGFRDGNGVQIVKVKAFSEAYFKVLDLFPELRVAFALGDRVLAAGHRIAVQTGDDGLERLGAADLATLRAGW
jgi:Ca-activated chloride channel family protein